ncbi:hypothetical protein [Corynebacterium rouxii]|uniref:Uncharacterized protein n=1 Tax=Corynebacterium rouxii TaxID=2719119 RepID=A0A6I8MEW3_9CORY|nr:hypothetical protein [Corynebacterium rouxii]MDT9407767.1 hypothetical protein [Corynebacterium rouxii]MDT9409948.1 hypothetical protein [Corynebacterium rouxii]VZH84023.1 hypothetical protein FRC0190_00070 [Corynebacterium rouxii]
MITHFTIRAAHEELGRPTDDTTIIAVYEQFREELTARSTKIFFALSDRWDKDHPEANHLRPGEVTGELHLKSIHRAQEEIMDEWFNEPIREIMAQRGENGEDGW